MQKQYQGQSVSECAIAIALAAVFCIGAATLLGGTVADGFKSISGGSNPEPEKAATGTNAGATNNGGGSGNGAAGEANGSPGSNINTDSMTALNYSSNFATNIETNGANGATEVVLGQMDAAIKQLLAEKAITPEEASKLQELSNIGHEMADVEAMIEKQFAINGNNPKAFQKSTFNYAGEEWELKRLVSHLQLIPSGNGFKPGSDYALINKFYNLQKSAVDSLQNPKAKELLGSLSTQVMRIADATEGAALDAKPGFSTTEFRNMISEYAGVVDPSNGKYPANVPPMASTATNNSAAAICEMNGKGKDNGKKCSKKG